MIEPRSICCLRSSYSRREIRSFLKSSSSLSICRFAWISYPAPVASTPVAAPPRNAQPDCVTRTSSNKTKTRFIVSSLSKANSFYAQSRCQRQAVKIAENLRAEAIIRGDLSKGKTNQGGILLTNGYGKLSIENEFIIPCNF